MAELNFGLLNPPGSQSIGNAFVTGMDQGQEARARDLQMQQSMRQGQMAELQFKKAQDAEAKLNQFYAHVADNGGPKDPVAIEDQMIGSGIPHVADAGLTARMARLKLETERGNYSRIMGGGASASTAASSTTRPSAEPGSFSADVAQRKAQDAQALAPTVNSLAPVATNALAAPNIPLMQRQRRELLALGTPQAVATANALEKDIELASKPPVFHVVPNVGLVNPLTKEVITPAAELKDPLIREYEYAKKEGFKGSLFDYKRSIASAGRAEATPSAPVAVLGSDGKTVYVSRDEAIRNKMTPASAMEGLAPKEIQKREAALPAATSAVTGFDTKAKSFIKDLIALRDDVGLDQITGPIYGRIGSVSREGSRAQALYDKIVAKGGFQALQDLRDASKTGGALGNVSNQEGKQLTASFAAIDRRQDAADVQAAINQAIADIEGARTRTREAYDSTYSYKSAAGQEAPAGAGKPSLADIFGGKKR